LPSVPSRTTTLWKLLLILRVHLKQDLESKAVNVYCYQISRSDAGSGKYQVYMVLEGKRIESNVVSIKTDRANQINTGGILWLCKVKKKVILSL
jgi:hypothetical protein